MVVAFTRLSDVIDAFHALAGQQCLSKVFFLLPDFESFNEGVLEKA